MTQHGMIGYVPYRDMNTTYKDQPFHTSHFVYNKENDYYICPQGKQLNYYHTSVSKKRKQTFRQYRTNELHTCKFCPYRDQCAPKNAARRIIRRESRQHLKEEMKQRLNSQVGKQMYQKRLHLIESFFGHIKYNLGYTHFLLRGLKKVKAEFTLICLTYNLRKLIAVLIYFLMVFSHNVRILNEKIKSNCYLQYVNELFENTLNIIDISLYIGNLTKVNSIRVLGQPA